jgi:hypothetical protein
MRRTWMRGAWQGAASSKALGTAQCRRIRSIMEQK